MVVRVPACIFISSSLQCFFVCVYVCVCLCLCLCLCVYIQSLEHIRTGSEMNPLNIFLALNIYSPIIHIVLGEKDVYSLSHLCMIAINCLQCEAKTCEIFTYTFLLGVRRPTECASSRKPCCLAVGCIARCLKSAAATSRTALDQIQTSSIGSQIRGYTLDSFSRTTLPPSCVTRRVCQWKETVSHVMEYLSLIGMCYTPGHARSL